MPNYDLTCVFFPDLKEWERFGPDTVITELSKTHRIQRIEADHSSAGLAKRLNGEPLWILARDWREASRVLGVTKKNKIFVSLFDATFTHSSLSNLVLRKVRPSIPSNTHLFAHSPIAHRFFVEMEKTPESAISLLPFPFPTDALGKTKSQKHEPGQPVTIGTLSNFTSESNLNYFLSVAHYVSHRRPEARFRILGCGPLYQHLSQLILELGLQDVVALTETYSFAEVGALDIFLYVPLRNEHFAPVLAAAANSLPVLSSSVPGIEQLIADGHNGFVIGPNETRSLAELVLRLVDDETLRVMMGKKLRTQLEEKYSPARVLAEYRGRFFGNASASQVRAAA